MCSSLSKNYFPMTSGRSRPEPGAPSDCSSRSSLVVSSRPSLECYGHTVQQPPTRLECVVADQRCIPSLSLFRSLVLLNARVTVRLKLRPRSYRRTDVFQRRSSLRYSRSTQARLASHRYSRRGSRQTSDLRASDTSTTAGVADAEAAYTVAFAGNSLVIDTPSFESASPTALVGSFQPCG